LHWIGSSLVKTTTFGKTWFILPLWLYSQLSAFKKRLIEMLSFNGALSIGEFNVSKPKILVNKFALTYPRGY
jgi:hypothetical protein